MKYTSIFTLTLLAAVPTLAFDITWVSHSGTNVFGCGSTTANPCLTFQYAYSNSVTGGGIIKAMDAGEYGPIQIGVPITIDGNGVAVIDVSSAAGYGVDVNTPITAGPVEIRNLSIHVPASCIGCSGIDINNFSVSIENVSITGTPSIGVFAGGSTATIRGVTVTGASVGIDLNAVTATISDSIVRYSNTGIQVIGISAVTQALIERSRMISNTTGLAVQNAGFATTARISDCVITGNTTGVSTSGGGQIITFRNNTWAGNTTDGATPFSVSLK